MTDRVLIAGCEVEGRRVDVRLGAGRILALAPSLTAEPGEQLVVARGGALLPGLHDHHLHLYALAAARASVACGPPEVADAAALREALGSAPTREGWVRGIGYDESVAGPLDRTALDALRGDVPVRVQHRTGALWMLNSRGLAALGLDDAAACAALAGPGADPSRGRLFRADTWLRGRLEREIPPDLGELSRELARMGITGVTDAGADNDAATYRQLARARASRELLQRLRVMGDDSLADEPAAEGATQGERKILLDDAALPTLEGLVQIVRGAHARGRGVAIHAVTRTSLVLALAALRDAGGGPADRIEHASLAPDDLVEQTGALGVRVVGQPVFVHDRGDRYLRDVAVARHPWLHRGRSWLGAGVPLAAGSDAPYGSPDPWRAMRAAVARQTREGQPLGRLEALSPEEALALFTSSAGAAGGPVRRVEVGAPADLCLLARPWLEARARLSREDVCRAWVGGREVGSNAVSAI